ncbi:MAG: hypothetical protein U1C04_15165 [Hydrogenophaga sp.]|uniref:hypothetical protein n=1 Tax=Hydrogenophaga sp. TaxID=1904254 RepID=UPI002ABA42DE|nr:hypothetical protein [Hydrogenophaga sp.]MDZ4282093.1 hypothetical protein [Hydrogenophaga sp.]
MVEYFEALDRLKKGANKVVPKGTRITNDSVALEAGRGKGSIKKSRPVFTALIAAIEAAASEQAQPINDAKSKLKAAKEDTARYKAMWLQTLSREQSLVKQLWDERMEWTKKEAELTGEKVTSIHAKRRQKQT